eukprot:jgi/Botrbrau1/18340/Bobra.0179s0067.1
MVGNGNAAWESVCRGGADANLDEGDQQSDSFRMFSFKIQPCPLRTQHPWETCAYAHPHENARRRDPRAYKYIAEPCPDYKNGLCFLGSRCPYSHGVYEKHLHPSKYRTQLCTEGKGCTRRVCFFAHTPEQLRDPWIRLVFMLSKLNYCGRNIWKKCSILAKIPEPEPVGMGLTQPRGGLGTLGGLSMSQPFDLSPTPGIWSPAPMSKTAVSPFLSLNTHHGMQGASNSPTSNFAPLTPPAAQTRASPSLGLWADLPPSSFSFSQETQANLQPNMFSADPLSTARMAQLGPITPSLLDLDQIQRAQQQQRKDFGLGSFSNPAVAPHQSIRSQANSGENGPRMSMAMRRQLGRNAVQKPVPNLSLNLGDAQGLSFASLHDTPRLTPRLNMQRKQVEPAYNLLQQSPALNDYPSFDPDRWTAMGNAPLSPPVGMLGMSSPEASPLQFNPVMTSELFSTLDAYSGAYQVPNVFYP